MFADPSSDAILYDWTLDEHFGAVSGYKFVRLDRTQFLAAIERGLHSDTPSSTSPVERWDRSEKAALAARLGSKSPLARGNVPPRSWHEPMQARNDSATGEVHPLQRVRALPLDRIGEAWAAEVPSLAPRDIAYMLLEDATVGHFDAAPGVERMMLLNMGDPPEFREHQVLGKDIHSIREDYDDWGMDGLAEMMQRLWLSREAVLNYCNRHRVVPPTFWHDEAPKVEPMVVPAKARIRPAFSNKRLREWYVARIEAILQGGGQAPSEKRDWAEACEHVGPGVTRDAIRTLRRQHIPRHRLARSGRPRRAHPE